MQWGLAFGMDIFVFCNVYFELELFDIQFLTLEQLPPSRFLGKNLPNFDVIDTNVNDQSL